MSHESLFRDGDIFLRIIFILSLISFVFTETVYVMYRHFGKNFAFNKHKTFSVLIYSYINTSGIGKTRNCTVFHTISSFPNYTSADITVYQYRKMFYISFII